MSGPVVHHYVSRQVVDHLIERGIVSNRMKETMLFRFSPFLHFGSQGPDFLFFNTKDWGSEEVRKAVHISLDVYKFIEDFKEALNKLIPLDELRRLDEAAVKESTIYDQIRSLLVESRDTMRLLEANLEAAITNFITNLGASWAFDKLIGHPEQASQAKYQDKSQWWWFDILHYRRTGHYAHALMQNARRIAGEESLEFAYALGYMTHFATDTVGHPYVNLLCGGPYRTHSQRHKFVENHHDVAIYQSLNPGQEFVRSELYKEYLLEGRDDRLPDRLGNVILETMNQVYRRECGPLLGRSLTRDDLNDSYALWMLWFKKSTTVLKDLAPPRPYSLDRELGEAWERLTREVGEVADMFTRPFRGGGGILSFFEFLAALIMAPFLMAKAIVDFILGSVTTIAVAPLRLFLSVAYEGLYTSFLNFHQGTVLNGLAFPFNNQLDHYLARHVQNPASPDNCGNHAEQVINSGSFPSKKLRPVFRESHLVYPFRGAPAESASVNPGPTEYLTRPPSYYMSQRINTNPETYAALSRVTESNLEAWRRMSFNESASLGSAVTFSAFLYEEFLRGRVFANFNLDADRGYGFKTWRLKSSTREMLGSEADFARINQIEENPDHNVPDTLMDIL